jgi:hypothetical protein
MTNLKHPMHSFPAPPPSIATFVISILVSELQMLYHHLFYSISCPTLFKSLSRTPLSPPCTFFGHPPQTHICATKLQAKAQWSAAHPNFCGIQSPVNEHIQQKGDDPCRHLRDCQRAENMGQEKAVGEEICKLQNGTLCL